MLQKTEPPSRAFQYAFSSRKYWKTPGKSPLFGFKGKEVIVSLARSYDTKMTTFYTQKPHKTRKMDSPGPPPRSPRPLRLFLHPCPSAFLCGSSSDHIAVRSTFSPSPSALFASLREAILAALSAPSPLSAVPLPSFPNQVGIFSCSNHPKIPTFQGVPPFFRNCRPSVLGGTHRTPLGALGVLAREQKSWQDGYLLCTSLARSHGETMMTFSPQMTEKATKAQPKWPPELSSRAAGSAPNRAFFACRESQPISLFPNKLSPICRPQKGPKRPSFSPPSHFLEPHATVPRDLRGSTSKVGRCRLLCHIYTFNRPAVGLGENASCRTYFVQSCHKPRRIDESNRF